MPIGAVLAGVMVAVLAAALGLVGLRVRRRRRVCLSDAQPTLINHAAGLAAVECRNFAAVFDEGNTALAQLRRQSAQSPGEATPISVRVRPSLTLVVPETEDAPTDARTPSYVKATSPGGGSEAMFTFGSPDEGAHEVPVSGLPASMSERAYAELSGTTYAFEAAGGKMHLYAEASAPISPLYMAARAPAALRPIVLQPAYDVATLSGDYERAAGTQYAAAFSRPLYDQASAPISPLYSMASGGAPVVAPDPLVQQPAYDVATPMEADERASGKDGSSAGAQYAAAFSRPLYDQASAPSQQVMDAKYDMAAGDDGAQYAAASPRHTPMYALASETREPTYTLGRAAEDATGDGGYETVRTLGSVYTEPEEPSGYASAAAYAQANASGEPDYAQPDEPRR